LRTRTSEEGAHEEKIEEELMAVRPREVDGRRTHIDR
jgi:hypothetical protein